MKKYVLCLFVIIMVIMCAGAHADSGVGGSVLTWTLQDGVLTISGEGAMDNYDSNNLPPWEGKKTKIQSLVINPGATRIGSYAFSGCTNLNTIDLPVGIETIGAYAFSNCPLTNGVNLPNGLISIGEYAFESCGFSSFEMPDTVTELGFQVFGRVFGNSSYKLSKGLKTIPGHTRMGFLVQWV